MTNLETEPAAFAPPTSADPPPERRWARSDDRIVFGVAGGLARAVAIDPLLVRVAFVVLGLFSGVGVLLYLAAWALMADSPTSSPPSTIRRIAGAVAVVFSVRWLLQGNGRLPDAGWVVAIGLFGVAVALWRGRAPAETTAAPPPTGAPTQPSSDSHNRWIELSSQRRLRERRQRSPLGLLTTGAAAVIGSIVWLIDHGSANRGAGAFGAATIVLGAGLVVGAFVGRARWLIVLAIGTSVAALVAAGFSFAGVGLDHSWGDRTEFVATGSNIAPRYRTGVGDFELILEGGTSVDASTEVDVAVGNLRVIVPDDVKVEIDARVGVGRIDTPQLTRGGYRRAASATITPSTNTRNASTIHLVLRVGVGNIEVQRGSAFEVPFDGLPVTVPLLPGDPPPAPSVGPAIIPPPPFGNDGATTTVTEQP
ncbi:MAG TPA: PspC domain-containing protein [Ilumatobacteraceae bacterium]